MHGEVLSEADSWTRGRRPSAGDQTRVCGGRWGAGKTGVGKLGGVHPGTPCAAASRKETAEPEGSRQPNGQTQWSLRCSAAGTLWSDWGAS